MGKWQSMIPTIRKKLRRYTYKPTIRGMFYSLVSDGLIENTKGEYDGFIDGMTTARRNGSIPIYAFDDTTRWINEISDDYKIPFDYVNHRVNLLKNAPNKFFDDIPRWHKQPHYVEIMVEKNALRGLFTEIVKSAGLEVRVVPNNGWSSMVYRHENINRLLQSRVIDTDDDGNIIYKQFHVLYFGDFDPSGTKMDRNVRLDLALASKGLRGIKLEQESHRLREGREGYHGEIYDWLDIAREKDLFKRVALTESQITEYGLEHLTNPEFKVSEKLKRDPNAQEFKKKYGSLFQIELDVMQKEGLEETFKQLVIKSVNHYFKQDIYDKMIKEHTPKEITTEVNRRVKFLD